MARPFSRHGELAKPLDDKAATVTPEEVQARIIAGEGVGEAFDRFRLEAVAGLRAVSDQVAFQSAGDLLRTFSIRAVTVERSGRPAVGFTQALDQLRQRIGQNIMSPAFDGRDWLFVVFVAADDRLLGCIGVRSTNPSDVKRPAP